MGPGRVVVTDCDHGHLEPETAVLSELGVALRVEACRTATDVISRCGDADVLLNQYAPVDDSVFEALPQLRLVVRYGVGVDNIDVAAATRHGIWVVNVPDYGASEVADHSLALSLALLRGVAAYDRSIRRGSWDYSVARPLRRLSALTYGVVGCGAIGLAVARRAAAFGMRVIGFDARPEISSDGGLTRVSLDELLATSDVVSLHAGLDASSRHLIDASALHAMQPTAILVNTARGGLVDTAALLGALDSGGLAGAALDVLEVEPIETHVRDRLTRHERVVLSPHAAWYSEESFRQLKGEVACEALRVLSGRTPRSPVNAPLLNAR